MPISFLLLYCVSASLSLSSVFSAQAHHRTMHFKTLTRPSHITLQHLNLKRLSPPPHFLNPSLPRLRNSLLPQRIRISSAENRHGRLIPACISPGSGVIDEIPEFAAEIEDAIEIASVPSSKEGGGGVTMEAVSSKREDLTNQSIWKQMKEIVMFSGPATGLWICAPLMSLIDTAVIGQGSSVELAALGPGTVLCDNLSYVFMFLSIATSNMVATSLAAKDRNEVQHQISILLFVGLTAGVGMLLFTRFFGSWALTAFAGPKNAHIVPAASKYVQIRGLAWPAVLIGWVAQSASLGMKDSWGPLKALVVASVLNVTGHVILCSFLGYGISGAAWATMLSQVVAAFMMIQALNDKGYKGFAISVPTRVEILQIIKLAAPVFITMASKVAFYSLIIYFATSMGTHTVAGHQIMIQMYSMCVVWGEPLSQTAQSFMPELIYGVNRSLVKARTLLKSLVIIGGILGLVLGTIGTSVPWLFPNIFTSDPAVIGEMHKVLIPFFIALSITPCTHSLEGTLLAGRDLKFISLTMSGCFSLGALLLLFVSKSGYGLPGFWCALVAFQWARFLFSLRRLISADGVLYSEDVSRYEPEKLKVA